MTQKISSENEKKLREKEALFDISLNGLKNRDKIMIVLQAIKSEIMTQDLADLTGIHNKSIGRYLNELETGLCITRKAIKEGSKRYVSISLTEKGKEYIPRKPAPKKAAKAAPKKAAKKAPKKKSIEIGTFYKGTSPKAVIKKALMEMFLTLPVRKVDYSKFDFKTSAAFRAEFIEMLNKL